MFPLTAPFEKPALENLFEAYVLLEFLLIQLYFSSSCFSIILGGLLLIHFNSIRIHNELMNFSALSFRCHLKVTQESGGECR